MATSRSKPLALWDQTRQQAYRAQHPESTFVFHLLLDARGSLYQHEADLRSAYHLYLRWLQHNAPPMSLVDVRCFGTTLQKTVVQALGLVSPLTTETYASVYGGTALYDALGSVVSQASEPGQHILAVFTDGQDCDSVQWSAGQVCELLRTFQEHNDRLCVFLGAFPEALEVAALLGFAPGNCLVFGSEKIPEAFERLRHATESISWPHHPSASYSLRAAYFMKGHLYANHDRNRTDRAVIGALVDDNTDTSSA